jgi:signal transduction histidine kinase
MYIVKSVLHFAQQELGDRWPADLNQIVRTVVDIARHYAEQRGACITLDLVPVLRMLLVNSVAIEQVRVNLVRNAVRLPWAPAAGGAPVHAVRQRAIKPWL